MATRRRPQPTAAGHFLQSLRCPETGLAGFAEHGSGEVVCEGSGRSWPVRDGYIDFVPPLAESVSPAQHLMEQAFYSAGYEEYFRPALTRLVSRQSVPDAILLSLAMLAPRAGDYVLDVGCGTGNFTRAIGRRLADGDGLVVGLDLSAPMLRHAEVLRRGELLRTVRYVRADAHRLPFADAVFDAVHCAGSLQLMPEPQRALAEMVRVLKPGGRLVVATFIRSPRRWLRRFQQVLTPVGGFRFFEPEVLHDWVAAHGLELREEMIEGAAITFTAVRPSASPKARTRPTRPREPAP